MLAHLNQQNFQIGDIANLAHLNDGSLGNHLKLFLLNCQVNNLSHQSIADYAQKIGSFVTFCDTMGVSHLGEVNTNHVRLFLINIQQRCKPISVKDYYGCINRFFNWLIEEEVIQQNPMSKMHPPKVPKELIKPFTSQEITDLLTLCDNTFLGIRNRAIILTLLDSGLRLSELAALKLEDINLDQGIIKVMGKGAKERLVRIGKETQRAMLKYLLQRNDNLDCLWVSEERRPLNAEGIQTMIRRLGKRAGITGTRCSPHTFRHTFGTSALKLGADIRDVQTLLGHSTLTMTLKYVSTVNSEQAVKKHQRFSPVDNMRL